MQVYSKTENIEDDAKDKDDGKDDDDGGGWVMELVMGMMMVMVR